MTEVDQEKFFKDKSENDSYFGVYKGFAKMPAFGDMYDSEANLESTDVTREWLSLIKEGDFPPPVPYQHIANVFVMAVSALRHQRKPLNILEIGARSGLACVSLLQSETWTHDQVNYFFLDRSSMIEKLREEDTFAQAGFSNVDYIADLDELPRNTTIDFVLISSHLQFIEDYKGTLQKILTLKPRRILFSHLAVCRSVDTFSTYQVRFVPSPLRRWIFSSDELIDTITSGGRYDLTYQADCYKDKFTFSEFPKAYQDCTYAHLLFNRRD